MATVGVSASASGPGPGPVDFDDSSSVASDLSTLDFQGDFHTDLIDIILDIKPPGNISVNEVGKVALPLGESQARQAPLAKGPTLLSTRLFEIPGNLILHSSR
ncbi:hypothetical protein FCULG_00007929 [Fusarium culmorum]|uniref:Uncharacterized protein n=1 Tax=Fusarium culmorum TaxID=5516 RepID=A0A2T4H4H8_FUSCU|nr:hypothetical protein FCULG_00007929 [Fusarium culmorum]